MSANKIYESMCPDEGEIVVRVSDVSKEYKLYDSPRQRFKALFSNKVQHRSHWALRNISFLLKRGQCVGVVGDNGAGKSSLLKLLAGTMQPSFGSIERVGRVTAILELGAGFHPEFSGRDNLYFAGNLIGISREEMLGLEASIVEFSELGDAMGRSVKTYSSGMVVRLAFSLVTAVRPDVLIVDEALAVGDQHFQKKCIERIEDFRKKGCTILFCSHSLYHVRQLCELSLWLHEGEIQSIGNTEDVLAAYEAHVRGMDAVKQIETQSTYSVPAEVLMTDEPSRRSVDAKQSDKGRAGLISVKVTNMSVAELPVLLSPDLQITVQCSCLDPHPPSIGIMLEQDQGVGITSVASHADHVEPAYLGNGVWEATLVFDRLSLHTGTYVISAYLFDHSGFIVYDEWKNYITFLHRFSSMTPGLITLPHRWI